jgi:hypothetical protein
VFIMNYENQKLEGIITEVAKGVMTGLNEFVIEAVEMGIGERWNDIIDAVVETNAPSNEDKLITRIKELEEALVGTSCVVIQAPVVASEPVVEPTVDEFVKTVVEEAMSSSVPSMMDEMDKEETEEEKALWADFDAHNDDLLPEDKLPMEFLEEEEPVIEEEDTFDPFAEFNLDAVSDEEVHDSLTGAEEFDPFNTNTEEDEDELFVSEFSDEDIPAIPAFEEEEDMVIKEKVMDIPAQAPAMPLVNPLGKGDAKMVTYQVFDKEVSMLQSNARIKDVADGRIRRMAFDLNTIMAAGNAKSRKSPEEKMMGKFYTQMIREWGLEIAAANNIATIKGDAGAAILIAELFYSLQTNGKLVSPALRFRNDGEREKAAVAYRGMQNPATRSHYMTLVDTYKASFAMEPALFAGDKAQTREQQLQAGYALLHARMSTTWENAAGKTVCVFPEVNNATVKGGALV